MKKIALILLLFIFSISLFSQSKHEFEGKISKISTNDHIAKIQTPSIEYYFSNNGIGATDPLNANSKGFYYPANSGKSVVYLDGFVWSGYIEENGFSTLKSGGATYRSGLQPGKILTNGFKLDNSYNYPVADDATQSKYRVYSIYKDWQKLPDSDPKKAGFQEDYNNWPIDQGAPVNDDQSPKFLGDYVLFHVANDMSSSRTNNLYGSNPMGLEVQTTIWGYNRQWDSDKYVYIKKKIINKSGLPITDYYMSIWSDQDLGSADDDFVGVDTDLNLGYTYNADNNDKIYGASPPAHSYMIVSGQTPSSFVYYINVGPAERGDPLLGNPSGTIMLNRYQRGLNALGNPILNSDNTETKFELSGDPVSNSGYLDGFFGAGDRRILYSFGPYDLQPGESIEVTYAVLVAQGNSNLNSITKLRNLAKTVKDIYDGKIDPSTFPVNPPTSELVSKVSDRKIDLNWILNTSEIEKHRSNGYMFEGYKVYQYDNSGLKTEVAYFDSINAITTVYDSISTNGGWTIYPVALGTNSGIKRNLSITSDVFTQSALINGFKYDFGVSAVFVRPDTVNGVEVLKNPNIFSVKFPVHFEIPITNKLTISPAHNYEHGSGYWYSGDTLATQKSNPFGNRIDVIVADPVKLEKADFQIKFDTTSSITRWKLVNTTKSTESALFDLDYSGLVGPFWIHISNVVPSFSNFLITSNANGVLDPPSYGAFSFNGTFPTQGPYQTNNSTGPSTNSQSNGSRWGIATGFSSSLNVELFETFINRVTSSGSKWKYIIPNDWEIRFTQNGGKAIRAYSSNSQPAKLYDVPFEIWNVGTKPDASDDVRYFPSLLENNNDDVFGLSKIDHPASGGDNDPETDWIYFIIPKDTSPGETGYNAILNDLVQDPTNIFGSNTAGTEAMRRITFVNYNGGSVSAGNFPANVNSQMPETGTIFKIVTTKPALADDYVSFSTFSKSTVGIKETNLPKSFSLSQNYPNPFNPETSINFDLKDDALVRLVVYDLLGREVKVITNELLSAGHYSKKWDATNKNGLSVATGIYFYKLEVNGSSGVNFFTKINKMLLLK